MAVLMLRFPPRSLMYAAVALGLLYVVPFFTLINTADPWLIALAMIIWFPIISLPFAAYPTLFGDLFDERIRYASMSIGFNIAGIVSGLAPAALVAIYAATQSWLAIVGVLAAGMLVTLACVVMMGTRGIREGVERDRERLGRSEPASAAAAASEATATTSPGAARAGAPSRTESGATRAEGK